MPYKVTAYRCNKCNSLFGTNKDAHTCEEGHVLTPKDIPQLVGYATASLFRFPDRKLSIQTKRDYKDVTPAEMLTIVGGLDKLKGQIIIESTEHDYCPTADENIILEKKKKQDEDDETHN